MACITINGLRLSYEYFGSGPGRSGVSQLSIQEGTAGLEITIVPDLTDPDPDHVISLKLGQDSTWRAVVAAINDDDTAYAFFCDGDTEGEYPWPWEMRFEGPLNYASELIALAWAGPPLSEFAVSISAAADEQLDALRRQAGTFLSRPFVERAIDLQKLTWEIETPLEEFVERQRGANLDLRAIYEEANKRYRELIGEDYPSKI